MAKKPAPKQPVKPAPPPPKGQKPPAPPVSGKSEAKPTGNMGKPTTFGVPVKPALPVKPSIKPLPSKGDLGKPLVKSGQISAEMYAVGKGSRLCQSLMMALKHEGKPSHVSDEKYLQRFASYGWDEEEDKLAERLLKLWQDTTDSEEELIETIAASGERYLAMTAQQRELLQQQLVREEISLGEFLRLMRESFTDRRALNEQLDALYDGENSLSEYETLLESIYGYNIQNSFAEETPITQQIQQYRNLAVANLSIVQYFDGIGLTGMQVFNEYFSENSRVVVHMGDDIRVLAGGTQGNPQFEGFVDRFSQDRRYDIALGSQVSVATITHEFFHQLDRAFGNSLSSSQSDAIMSLEEYLNSVAINSIWGTVGLPYQRELVLAAGNAGGASDLLDPAEYFPDLGMTAVLDGLELTVSPFNDTPIVAFADSQNARDVNCALRQYFAQVLSGQGNELTFESCT